jgi:hypothetical protein
MRRTILESKKKEEHEAQLISIKIGQAQSSQKHLKELVEERDRTILDFVGSYMKKMNDFKDVNLPLSQEMNELFFKKVKLLLDAITNKLKVFAEKHKTDEEGHEKDLEKVCCCLIIHASIQYLGYILIAMFFLTIILLFIIYCYYYLFMYCDVRANFSKMNNCHPLNMHII